MEGRTNNISLEFSDLIALLLSAAVMIVGRHCGLKCDSFFRQTWQILLTTIEVYF